MHELLRRLTVNELLGNADAHLKNIGLIYRDGRTAELSPAYDVVALCLYGVKSGHALRLLPEGIAPAGAPATPSLLTPSTVRDFCRALGINPGPAGAVVRQAVLAAAKTWPALIRASSRLRSRNFCRLARARENPSRFSKSASHAATKACLLAWVSDGSGRFRQSHVARRSASQCSG